MSKHTPGPWLVDFEQDDLDSRASVLRVLDSRSLDHPQGPLVIATINVAAHAPHLDEPLHNASVIGAAPALLAELKFAVKLLRPIAGHTVQFERMEAVIALAEAGA